MDAAALHVRLWGLLNGEPEKYRETLSMLSPFMQAFIVYGTGQDVYSGQDIERYGVVPQWFMDMDAHLTGGHIVKAMGVRWESVPDPASEQGGYYNSGRWVAKNGRMWWTLRTLLQLPPFGRSMDTITKLNQADSLAWALPGGLVSAAQAVGPVMDPVPEIMEQMAAHPGEELGVHRTGFTEGQEVTNALGFKTMPVDTESMALSRMEKQRAAAVRAAQKEAERGEPHRYGQ